MRETEKQCQWRQRTGWAVGQRGGARGQEGKAAEKGWRSQLSREETLQRTKKGKSIPGKENMLHRGRVACTSMARVQWSECVVCSQLRGRQGSFCPSCAGRAPLDTCNSASWGHMSTPTSKLAGPSLGGMGSVVKIGVWSAGRREEMHLRWAANHFHYPSPAPWGLILTLYWVFFTSYSFSLVHEMQERWGKNSHFS